MEVVFEGGATAMAEKLKKDGFQIVKVGNAEHFNYQTTTIKYKEERVAEFLKKFLKNFQIEPEAIKIENQTEDIILIVGKDFKF